jgi:plasmid stabilization system protein ParE
MHKVVFHRLASREVLAAKSWYQSRSELTHQRFHRALAESVDRVMVNPTAFSALTGRFRYVRLRRFPYILIFELRADNTVFVVAVAHTSRRPGYWRGRK